MRMIPYTVTHAHACRDEHLQDSHLRTHLLKPDILALVGIN